MVTLVVKYGSCMYINTLCVMFNNWMLVYGTANPAGYGNGSYTGVYLTDVDIDNMIPSMQNIPVKIEHKGHDVGHVVTAWCVDAILVYIRKYNGRNH